MGPPPSSPNRRLPNLQYALGSKGPHRRFIPARRKVPTAKVWPKRGTSIRNPLRESESLVETGSARNYIMTRSGQEEIGEYECPKFRLRERRRCGPSR